MISEESKYLIALSYIKGLGTKSLNELLSNLGSPTAIWHLSQKEKNSIKGLRKNVAEQIGNNDFIEKVEQELAYADKNHIQVHTILDDGYPKRLKECIDAPPVVFSKGNINWNDKKFVAIVGTRKMTARGKDFVDQLIADLAQQSITIVSGLALGIDSEAHKAAIAHDLQTIAVLAHGLKEIFPKSNKKIGIDMQQNGGLFSEFSTFHNPEPENFLRRNRIIAGLCDATIVVESGIAGGAMNTARHANNYNRDVFAVPGRTTDYSAAGCHHLIKNHQAFLITEAQDLLKYLNIAPKKKKIQKELFVDLSPSENQIYQLLKSKGKQHLDQLALELNLASYQLMPILLDLELKNIVSPLPGKFYDLN